MIAWLLAINIESGLKGALFSFLPSFPILRIKLENYQTCSEMVRQTFEPSKLTPTQRNDRLFGKSMP